MSQTPEATVPLIDGKTMEYMVLVMPDDAIKLEEALVEGWAMVTGMPKWVVLARKK